jgi:hypothetical protein
VFIDLLDTSDNKPTSAQRDTAAAVPAAVRPAALEAAIPVPAFAETGGGAAVGNPTLARGTQLGNPNIRPGSLRERAAQANAARAAQTNANAATTTTTAPPQQINRDT